MKNKDFVSVQVTLSADVADSGTFTVNYPAGYNLGDFENAVGHYIVLNGDRLVQPQHVGLSFGSGAVTVTNRTGGTLPQGAKGFMQFELAGAPAPVLGESSPNTIQRVHAVGASLLLIDFGSPLTLDADGLWDGISVGATAATFTVSDMKTATANMAGLGYGVLDVPRTLTLVGSASADHVVTINGYDEYDEPMSETLTANSTTPVAGVKAFKRVVSLSVAAGGAASKTLDIGWADTYGLPLRLTSQYCIINEIIDGSTAKRLADIELIPFQALEAEIDAGTSVWVAPGFAGSVLSMTTSVGDTITTGGTISVEIGGTAVDGLGVVVADSSAAGDIDTDTATSGHATANFTAAQALEIVFPSAFNASGRINGTIECRRSSILNGTFVAGLAKNTKSTATTADVRGTYTPPSAADGAISVQLLVRVDTPGDLGNVQYAA